MPEPRAAISPLARARSELRRTEARLAALAEACTRPCEHLLAALRHLPSAARWQPFPAAPAEPAAGSARGHEYSGKRGVRGQAPGAVPVRSEAALPGSQERATPQASAVPRQEAVRSGLGPRASTQPEASRSGGRSHEPGAHPSPAFGAAVAALLARWPETPDTAFARLRPPPAPAGGSLADTPLGPMLQQLVAQTSGRPGAGQSAPARQDHRPPAEAGATAAAVADLLGRHAPAAPRAPAGLSAPLAGQGPSLLLDLLAGAIPAAPRSAIPAPAPRQAAPRARSRLTQDAGAEAASARRPPEASGSDPLPGQEGSELAQQLNRLLLDQAWLRGVDLT
jgi:hypothetical protein